MGWNWKDHQKDTEKKQRPVEYAEIWEWLIFIWNMVYDWYFKFRKLTNLLNLQKYTFLNLTKIG